MKTVKSLILVLVALLLVVPFSVFAEEITPGAFNTTDLKGTLDAEEIEYEFDDYEPSEDAINIYMFRGQGCGYCRKFLTFLNSITDDYGKYFNLVAFEVWQDQDNSELLTTVAAALNEEAGGVPFIVIGDKVFPGYSEEYDESIKDAIKDLYEEETSKRYDVFDHLEEKTEKKEKKNKSNDIIVGVVTVLIIGGIGAAAVFIRKNN